MFNLLYRKLLVLSMIIILSSFSNLVSYADETPPTMDLDLSAILANSDCSKPITEHKVDPIGFNPGQGEETKVQFNLSCSSIIKLSILNMDGREIITLIDNVEKKGLVAIPEGMTTEEFYTQRRVATKSSKNHMYELSFTNGTTWLVSDTKLPDGGFLQVYSDISEMKEKDKEIKLAQEQVRETEKRMTDALNSMPHGITMWDKDDTLVFANTFAREIQGGAGVKFDIGERYEDYLQKQRKHKFMKFNSPEEEKEYSLLSKLIL